MIFPVACRERELLPDGRMRCRACGKITEANHYQACGVQSEEVSPQDGPGTEFAALAKELGLAFPCGGCKLLLADMNRWGPDGCEERRAEILARMRENEKYLGWGEWLEAGAMAALAGYTSLEDLLDEAIRRSRAKAR